MKYTIAVLALTALAGTGAALAQTVYPTLNPGSWTTTTSVTVDPFAPTPQTSSETACISEGDATFDPEELLAMEGCSISNLVSTSTSVEFDTTCTNSGLTTVGDGEVNISDDGNAMDGLISLTGTVPGSQMAMMVSVVIDADRDGVCES